MTNRPTKRTRTKPMHIAWEPELFEIIGAVAAQRRVSRTDLVHAAVEAYLDPDAEDRRDAALARRLARIDARLNSLARDTETTAELVATLARVYLTHTAELPEDQKPAAARAGGRRYALYTAEVGKRLARNNTVFQELPASRSTTPEDFTADADGETPAQELTA